MKHSRTLEFSTEAMATKHSKERWSVGVRGKRARMRLALDRSKMRLSSRELSVQVWGEREG